MPDVGRRGCLYGIGVVAHDCARVAIARNEAHIIDARERPLQSRGILKVRNAQGAIPDDRRLLAAWTSRTIATTSWPSDANLQTTARPTWPVVPLTSIIMPRRVPA